MHDFVVLFFISNNFFFISNIVQDLKKMCEKVPYEKVFKIF